MQRLDILPSYTEYFKLSTTTRALNRASIWIGQAIPCFFYGIVSDAIGRKNSVAISIVVTALAIVLQTAAQNIVMFCIARILIGVGTGMTVIVAPIWLIECLPYNWRAKGFGL